MWKRLIYSTQRRVNPTNGSLNPHKFNLFSRFSYPLCASPSRVVGRIGGIFGPSDATLFPPSVTPLFYWNFVGCWNFGDSSFFCSEARAVEKSHRCWNCDAEAANETPFMFCQACRSVQPVNDSCDFFQIFGIERNFNIEMDALERKYKNWQKKLHPDLVHSKSQREREYASEQSALVTDAFRTLADSLSRAVYIMKLEDVVLDEEERIADVELLAEMMELREAVEEAEGSEALNQIQDQLQEKLQHWHKSFEDAFRNKQYEDAISSIRRMTYYKRANEEIVKKL